MTLSLSSWLLRGAAGAAVLAAAVLAPLQQDAAAGTFNFSSGLYVPSVTAPEPLGAADVLNINAGGNKFFSAVSFSSFGTVNWFADSLFMQNGAVISNSGLWDAHSDNALVNNGGPLSSFINGGTFRKSAGLGATTIGSISFTNSGIIDAQTGAIVFGGGNATFNAGTQFTGAGAVQVTSNAAFNGSFSSTNLALQSGTFTGGNAVINGAVDFTGGIFAGTWEVASGQTLTGKDGNNKFLSGAAITNKGTVAWQTADSLFLQNGAAFANQGLFNFQTGAALVNNGGPLSSFTNTGTVQVAAGQTATVGSIAFVNNGGALTVGTGGVLTFGGGNATFNAGTQFTGAGVVQVTSNARFVDGFSSQNLRLTNGTFTGGDGSAGSKAVVSGTVEFTGGLFAGTWEVASGQTLTGKDGNNKFLNGAALTNKGTVAWQTANSLFLQNGASVANQGLFDFQTGAALVNNGGPLSSFTNTGTVQVAAGQTASVGSIAFVNNGGVLTVGTGGVLTFGGGNATFNAGTQFTGAGVVQVTTNAAFNGSFSSANLALQNGTFTGGNAVINGSVDFTGGLFAGTWEVASGQTLTGKDGNNKFLNGAAITNKGTVAWQTANTLFLQNGASVANQGLFDFQADGSLIFNGGPAVSFVNTGRVLKSGGAGTTTIGNVGFDNQGVVDVRSGTIQLPNGFVNAGTLTGTGAFATTTLTNNGHVAPGSSPGVLTLNGNYAQTAVGFLDTELASSLLFDLFIIDGNASLDGTLALSCIDGCALKVGDEFVILDATGDLTGTFSQVTAQGFGDGFQYDLIYDYDADLVKLTVLQFGPGPGPVPQPDTWVLMLAGLGAVGWVARRRQCSSASA